MRSLDTKTKVLLEGKALLQRHGYHGFSFQDIADKLKIKKPSLYDHYGSKEELIVAILKDYGRLFDQWAESKAGKPPLDRVRGVFDVFYSFSTDKLKICPVLALGADTKILSKAVREEMENFVNKWMSWLEAQIKAGQADGSIRKDFSAKDLSVFIYSQGMGSQFQSRIKDDPQLTRFSGDLVVKFLRNTS